MQINLYSCSDDRRVLNKALSNQKTVNVNILDEKDADNPVYKLGYFDNFLSYNYAYVPKFNTYYFVRPSVKTGQEIVLYLEADAIMSIKDDIKNSTAHIIRSTKGNVYIPDSMATKTNRTTVQARLIGNVDGGSTNTDHYILIKGGNN